MGDIPVAALLPHIEYNEEGYVSVFYVGLYNVHTDHLNTPRRLTEENGAVVWQWDSDPFGVGHANVTVLGPSDFDLRFPGQIFDPENWPWQHYNYFRDYDPAIGRYVQSDPIGLIGGTNTYAYALSNPVELMDPAGLFVGKLWGCIKCIGVLRRWNDAVSACAEEARNYCVDIQREIKYMDYYGVTSISGAIQKCAAQSMGDDDLKRVFTSCQSCSFGAPVRLP